MQKKKNLYFHINNMIKYLNKKEEEEEEKRASIFIHNHLRHAIETKTKTKITKQQQSFDQMMSKGFVISLFLVFVLGTIDYISEYIILKTFETFKMKTYLIILLVKVL